MKLLEVVKGKHTTPETIISCMDAGKRIGKVAAIAGNCYGFIGNRMLEPYGREAMMLVEEGASPLQIDRVLKSDRVGFAMGLFEMSDLAGNDVSWRQRIERGLAPGVGGATNRTVSCTMDYPDMRYCGVADKLCEKGRFGQKTGGGWYDYDPKAPRKPLKSAGQ